MARNIRRSAPNRAEAVSLQEQVLGVSALSDDEKFIFGNIIQATIPLINNISSIHEVSKKEVLFRSQTNAAIDLAFMFVDSYRQKMAELNDIANSDLE